jgi:hypothetical protein
MRAIEFDTTMRPGGQILLPDDYVHEIPPGRTVRVIVMWQPRAEFDKAFDPEDTVAEPGR